MFPVTVTAVADDPCKSKCVESMTVTVHELFALCACPDAPVKPVIHAVSPVTNGCGDDVVTR